MKYTLSEFRARTREAFNIAEAAGEVLIERHGVMFQLRRLPYLTPEDAEKQPISLQDKLGTDLHPTTAARIVEEPKIENNSDWGA